MVAFLLVYFQNKGGHVLLVLLSNWCEFGVVDLLNQGEPGLSQVNF